MRWYTLKVAIFIHVLFFTGCRSHPAEHSLSKTEIAHAETYTWNRDSTILFFTNNMTVPTTTVPLEAGKYTLTYTAEGTRASGTAARMNTFIGDEFVKNDSIVPGLHKYEVKFELLTQRRVPLQFELYNYSSTGERRDVALHFPIQIRRFGP